MKEEREKNPFFSIFRATLTAHVSRFLLHEMLQKIFIFELVRLFQSEQFAYMYFEFHQIKVGVFWIKCFRKIYRNTMIPISYCYKFKYFTLVI